MDGRVAASLYDGASEGLATEQQFELPGLAPGVYFVQLQSDGKTTINEKLVIE